MSRHLLVLLCLFAVLATACSYGARRATPTPFVPGTPRPSATASWHELGEAYLVAADRAGRDFDRLFLRRGGYEDTVQGHHDWCDAFLSVDIEFAESVEKIPWTPDYQEQADEVLEKTDAVIALLNKCIKSKSLKNIRTYENRADTAYLARQKASEQLRKDLHLSTRPLR